jgi:hypothetical protein
VSIALIIVGIYKGDDMISLCVGMVCLGLFIASIVDCFMGEKMGFSAVVSGGCATLNFVIAYFVMQI